MKYLKILKRIVCIILSIMIISNIFYSSIVYSTSGTSTLGPLNSYNGRKWRNFNKIAN